MAIAQMNWGRMKYPPDDPRVAEFINSLPQIFRDAENHPGFIWRMPDDQAAREMADLGHNAQVSATVSVWRSVDALHDYTFSAGHGAYLKRSAEWFDPIATRQLVIWGVDADARPSFAESFERLDHLERHGDSDVAYGWAYGGSGAQGLAKKKAEQ